jgi:hypothetical protein
MKKLYIKWIIITIGIFILVYSLPKLILAITLMGIGYNIVNKLKTQEVITDD